MNWKKPLLFAAAVTVVAVSPALSEIQSNEQENQDHRVPADLHVQTAMQQARACLQRREYQTAVRILEHQLSRINGDAAYLALMEEAYRQYVGELKAKKGQEALLRKYADRLAILDPGVQLGAALADRSPAQKRSESSDGQGSPAAAMLSLAKELGQSKIRAHRDDEDAVRPATDRSADRQIAAAAIAFAHKEYAARRFIEAAKHYQRAFTHDRNLAEDVRERWAYCKLYEVTERINKPAGGRPDWPALEREVRHALELAPKLEHGNKLLHEHAKTLLQAIQDGARHTAGGASGRKETVRLQNEDAPPGVSVSRRISVQHLGKKVNGWQVAESNHFRVFHQDSDLAERVLETAEQTRANVQNKWFGDSVLSWVGKCDIYLHPTAAAYSRSTGVGPDSPGHTSIEAESSDASRIVSRRIDLHSDEPNMVRAVLPHEATHVVLAGQFGRKPLPRWADEGMAVLSEPDDRIRRHLDRLPDMYQQGRAFTARQIMTYANRETQDYPPPGLTDVFYGQSVVLVKYLTDLKGPHTFAEFLRDAGRTGYEVALRRHYDIPSFADLEQRWRVSHSRTASLD